VRFPSFFFSCTERSPPILFRLAQPIAVSAVTRPATPSASSSSTSLVPAETTFLARWATSKVSVTGRRTVSSMTSVLRSSTLLFGRSLLSATTFVSPSPPSLSLLELTDPDRTGRQGHREHYREDPWPLFARREDDQRRSSSFHLFPVFLLFETNPCAPDRSTLSSSLPSSRCSSPSWVRRRPSSDKEVRLSLTTRISSRSSTTRTRVILPTLSSPRTSAPLLFRYTRFSTADSPPPSQLRPHPQRARRTSRDPRPHPHR
jgi:hypothetical protein